MAFIKAAGSTISLTQMASRSSSICSEIAISDSPPVKERRQNSVKYKTRQHHLIYVYFQGQLLDVMS